MALVRKKVKGKVYLYEVRYENSKHVWKYIGKVTNELPTTSIKEAHFENKKAGPAGFEPATYGLEGRRSVQAELRAQFIYESVIS